MKYFEFPNKETKRDIQICFLDVAIHKEPINLDEYDALTDHDKKFYELAIKLEKPMRQFGGGIAIEAPTGEKDLLDILTEGEKQLKELTDSETDDWIGYDGIHSAFANLYGNGILSIVSFATSCLAL